MIPRRVAPAAALIAMLVGSAAAAQQASSVSANQAAYLRGEHVYQQWCAPCHSHGKFRPGSNALRRHGVDPPYLTERDDITPELTQQVVRNGIGAMSWFRKSEIDDAQLADLGVYLASAHLRAKKGAAGGH